MGVEWRAFIFDFDGVLVDSVDVKTQAFAEIYRKFGPEIVDKVVDHHKRNGGMSRFEKIPYYHREFLGRSLGEDEVAEIAAIFSELVKEAVIAAPPIKGAVDFLEDFNRSIPCFINSATPFQELREIVERRGWMSYFQRVYGAPRSKVENLKEILSRFGPRPEECLFFGDAYNDFLAAKECHVPFIAMAEDSHSPLLRMVPEIPWASDFTAIRGMLNKGIQTGCH